jgi:hypothetical protein
MHHFGGQLLEPAKRSTLDQKNGKILQFFTVFRSVPLPATKLCGAGPCQAFSRLRLLSCRTYPACA